MNKHHSYHYCLIYGHAKSKYMTILDDSLYITPVSSHNITSHPAQALKSELWRDDVLHSC